MLLDVFRQLRRTPGYTLFAIGLLSIGFGTAFAIACVLDAVLWRPLPVRDPDRLVQISETNPAAGVRASETSGPTAADWIMRARTFEGVAAYERMSAGISLITEAGSSTVAYAYGGWNYFDVIGALPRAGRSFTEAYNDEVVISDRLWRTRLGGRTDIIGRTIRLDGLECPVIGIMPPGFTLPGSTDIWRSSQGIRPRPGGKWRGSGDRDERTFEVIGRLKSGIDLERADTEMRGIASQIATEFPQSNQGWSTTVRPLAEVVTAPIKPLLLGVTVACVLLVIMTAANALTLALARAWLRRGALAVRTALGASPSRLFGQLLVERLVIAAFAAGLGLVVGTWALRVLQVRVGAFVARLDDIPIRPAIVLALVVIAVGLAILEAASLFVRCRPREAHVIRAASSMSLEDGRPMRTYGIIALQVALSVVLMAVALETGRQVFAFQHADRGYSPRNLLVARFLPERITTAGFLARRTSQEEMLATLESQVWVRAAALVSIAPFGGETWTTEAVRAEINGRSTSVTADYSIVSETFFDVLETPMVEGRRFDNRDNFSEAQVAEPATNVESVLINRTLARRLFGDASAVGRAVERGRQRAVVVGVVADTRLFPGRAEARPEIYGTFRQHNGPFYLTLVARTLPSHSMQPRYETLRSLLPRIGFFNVDTATQIIDAAIPAQRVGSTLIQVFALVALIVSVSSLGALVTLIVRSSRRSLAIRLVLGARVKDVIRVVGRQAAWSLGIGGVIGIGSAAGLGQWLVSSGYWQQTPNIWVLIAGAALLMTIEALAILIPGREALRIDPIKTLRAS